MNDREHMQSERAPQFTLSASEASAYLDALGSIKFAAIKDLPKVMELVERLHVFCVTPVAVAAMERIRKQSA